MKYKLFFINIFVLMNTACISHNKVYLFPDKSIAINFNEVIGFFSNPIKWTFRKQQK